MNEILKAILIAEYVIPFFIVIVITPILIIVSYIQEKNERK